MLEIRKATLDDLAGIIEIYNEAILKTVATFDTEPKTLEEQEKWFMKHGAKNPVIVAEEKDVIVGWAALSEWSDRCAYADAAEVSLYVKKEHQGRGIGRRLLENLVEKGKEVGFHTIIARIAEGNQISVHLHKSLGFEHIGIMREVGRKFGRLLDVHLMQKIYHEDTSKQTKRQANSIGKKTLNQ
jgi:L-amino acid N-acyltransferase YncA